MTTEALKALKRIDELLTNLQPHIPQSCHPKGAQFIDNYVDPALETARAAIACLESRSQRLKEAGFTRRPTWRSLPSDDDAVAAQGEEVPAGYVTAIEEGKTLFLPRASLNTQGLIPVYAQPQAPQLASDRDSLESLPVGEREAPRFVVYPRDRQPGEMDDTARLQEAVNFAGALRASLAKQEKQKAEAVAPRAEFVVYDGDEEYASTGGPREQALAEALRYASQCDSPRIEEIVRIPLPQAPEPQEERDSQGQP